jgi:two-component system cell cycle response regulator CtrA
MSNGRAIDVQARVRALEEENAMLQEHVAYLKDALCSSECVVPLEWGLSPSETIIVRVLLTREFVAKETLMAALYSTRPDISPDIRIISVFLCKVRKKLAQVGIQAKTVWGQGYQLPAEVRQKYGPKKGGRP